jgi:cation:H+ antiporter
MKGKLLRKDVFFAFVASLIPVFLILDKTLGRIDGLILITVYVAYTTSIFRSRYLEIAEEHEKESFIYRFLRHFSNLNGRKTKEFGRLFIGIALLLFSADMIVKISTAMALSFGIGVFIIGLVLLAFGTSLPEVAFSFRSLEDHEPSMFFGNLLGSIIANSTLILGVTALITPIKIVSFNSYFIAIIAFLVTFSAFWLFVRTKHRLDRWESLFLVALYIGFVVLTFS